MKKLITILFVLALSTLTALAQEKGVDKQSQVIRDTGNNRAPASNGTKTDVGTSGSGINFGKDRTPNAPPIPNPYRFSARRDVLIQAIEDLMRDRKLIPDTSASKPEEGIVISQPFTFTKGAVVSQGELSRYAQISDAPSRCNCIPASAIICRFEDVHGQAACHQHAMIFIVTMDGLNIGKTQR